ncbi:hypothetical protein [Cetobacterium sp. SF1]|uniref:hypothetical protein n=1 Tax=Cetobacterium sp. SF1 TaxID=3417654 RepID=UPI003CF43E70
MKKIIFIMSILCLNVYGISKDYEFKIRKEGRELYTRGSDINNYVEWQINSYDELLEKVNESSLSENNKKIVLKRLFSMYRYNFAKQNSVVNDEIEKYMLLENKEKKDIKKEKENKVYIEKIIENSEENSKKELEFLKKKAEQKYPNDYEKQKIYIEAVLENLNIYKFK